MGCTIRTANLGPIDIRTCTKFKRLSDYLTRCVQRANFHFMEAYGLYYSCTTSETHSSKGYLVHGPCFLTMHLARYGKLHYVQVIVRISKLLCLEGGFLFLKLMGCTIRTVNLETIAQRATWYMDLTYIIILYIRKSTEVKQQSHYLIHCVQRVDFHLWKPMGCTIRTANLCNDAPV